MDGGRRGQDVAAHRARRRGRRPSRSPLPRPPAPAARRRPRPTGRGRARSSRRTPRPRSTPGRGSPRRRGAGPRRRRTPPGRPRGTRRSSSLCRNGKPVAAIASRRRARADRQAVRRCAYAPPPSVAQYVSPSNGACTTPTIGSPSRDEPDRHADRGETVQEVRGAVERIDEPPERRRARRRSPHRRTRCRDSPSASASRTAFSLAVSTSLTQSPGAFARTLLSAPPKPASDDLAADARRALGHREQVREIEVASSDRACAARRAARGPGGDELARARSDRRARAVASSASTTSTPASRQTSSRRGSPTARGRCRRRSSRRARRATSHSASAHEPSARNCFHGSIRPGKFEMRDHRVLDARRRRRLERLAVAERALAPHRPERRRRSRGSRRARRAGRRGRARTATSPSTGCRATALLDPSTGSITTVIGALGVPVMPDSSLTIVAGTRCSTSSAASSATRSSAYWPGRSVRARRSAPRIGATASRIATAVLSKRVRRSSGMRWGVSQTVQGPAGSAGPPLSGAGSRRSAL